MTKEKITYIIFAVCMLSFVVTAVTAHVNDIDLSAPFKHWMDNYLKNENLNHDVQ